LPNQGLEVWWPAVIEAPSFAGRKDANSLILLVIRSLWQERNARVFHEKKSTSMVVQSMIINTWKSWSEVGVDE
jgi:hypothetical protein